MWQFQGQHGRAYLFVQVCNIVEGPAEDRTMTTGLHTVRDINCERCAACLGWKYVSSLLLFLYSFYLLTWESSRDLAAWMIYPRVCNDFDE